MLRSVTRTAFFAALLALPSVTLAVGANSPLEMPAGAPARAQMTIDGPILVTPAGMSLYISYNEDMNSDKFAWQCNRLAPRTTNDQQSGIGEHPQIGFKLLSSCLDKFPPYVAEAGARPVGDFKIAQRPEGIRQWVYRGAPLYLSVKDHRPGDHNGVALGFLGGGGGSRFGGQDLAYVAMSIPTGLKLMRRMEGLVLATSSDNRAVYTPHGNAPLLEVAGTNGREDFKPIAAPAIASVSGDWSIIDNGSGQKQFAFRGKRLYAAPASLNEIEVRSARNWDPVVVVQAPPLPAAIGQHMTLMGQVFTDKKGMTLYRYSCSAGGFLSGTRAPPVTCEDPGDPAAFMVALCGDGNECAHRWHPYIAAPGAKPEGEFSLVEITYPMFTDMHGKLYPDDARHVKVWAYRGLPLYTYYEDQKPGDIWGNAVGGIWGSAWNIALVPGGTAILEP